MTINEEVTIYHQHPQTDFILPTRVQHFPKANVRSSDDNCNIKITMLEVVALK